MLKVRFHYDCKKIEFKLQLNVIFLQALFNGVIIIGYGKCCFFMRMVRRKKCIFKV